MADRLCPFCGKPNPEDAQTCASCQARLVSPAGAGQASPVKPEDNLRDWLHKTGTEAAQKAGVEYPTETPPAAEPAPDENAPDWLLRIRERSRTEQESAAHEEKPPSKSGKTGKTTASLSDTENTEAWLNQLRTTQSSSPAPISPPTESQPAVPAGSEEESAEWLRKLEDWKETSVGRTYTEEELKASSGKPKKPFHTSDLKAINGSAKPVESPQAETKAEPAKVESVSELPATPEQKVPDWLQELESSFPPPEPEKKKSARGRDRKAGKPTQEQAETPSEAAAASSSAELPIPGGELPQWLSKMTPPAEETPGVKPVFEKEKPSSKKDSPFSTREESPAGGEIGEGGLAPAQLPAWLQALRPVESVVPEDLPFIGETSETGTGPLEGIADVLPGSQVSAPRTKPPAYSPNVKVNDRQKLHAQLLDSVVKEAERIPSLKPAEKPRVQAITQILVTIFALIGLLLPIILGTNGQLTPKPVFFPPETVALFDGIKSLPAQAPVLVIIDYQPSFSPELNTAALGVLEHLMTKDARLAVISSTPSGVPLANQLLTSAQQVIFTYSISQNSINLGYLPGGASGLLAFALQPRVAVRRTWQNMDPWAGTILQEVVAMTDFSAVVLISESPENVRLWVEQVVGVNPTLRTYLVTSAQAGPVVFPYYYSTQLKGMVSGLNGSMMYEQLLGQPGASSSLWDPFQIGITFAFVAILIGGILQATVFKARQEQE